MRFEIGEVVRYKDLQQNRGCSEKILAYAKASMTE